MASFFENFFGPGLEEFVEACEERKAFLDEQQRWLTIEKSKHDSEAKRLSQVLERTRQELVGYLLPEVKTSHLELLEKRLRFPGLVAVKQRYDRKFEECEKKRMDLEAKDEIQHFEFHLNQVDERIKDLQPGYDSVIEERKNWMQNVLFNRLNQREFFKIDDTPSWWQQILNWRDVSLLMGHLAKHGIDLDTPAEVENEFRLMHDQSSEVIDAYDRQIAERQRLLALKKDLDETIAAPERLLAELYRELGNELLTHFEACPEDVRIELAKNDSYLNTFFRKDVGLSKQITYLRELAVVRINSRLQQVNLEMGRLSQKISKMKYQIQRGKRKSFSKEQLAQMRNFNQEKWRKRRSESAAVRERISDFNDYGSGSFLPQFLWWDFMTGGMDGSDLFEVRQFHESNPNWNREQFIDPIEGVIDLDSSASALDDAADSLASEMTSPADSLLQDAS